MALFSCPPLEELPLGAVELEYNSNNKVNASDSDFEYRRSIARANLANNQKARLTGAVADSILALAPWDRRLYPGRRKVILEIIGRKVTWGAVQHWMRDPEATPVDALGRFEAALREQAWAMLELATQLDTIKAAKLAKPRKRGRKSALEEWRQSKGE